jgi:hypothetical protein
MRHRIPTRIATAPSDFSPETIEQRANEGYKQTELALQA